MINPQVLKKIVYFSIIVRVDRVEPGLGCSVCRRLGIDLAYE